MCLHDTVAVSEEQNLLHLSQHTKPTWSECTHTYTRAQTFWAVHAWAHPHLCTSESRHRQIQIQSLRCTEGRHTHTHRLLASVARCATHAQTHEAYSFVLNNHGKLVSVASNLPMQDVFHQNGNTLQRTYRTLKKKKTFTCHRIFFVVGSNAFLRHCFIHSFE